MNWGASFLISRLLIRAEKPQEEEQEEEHATAAKRADGPSFFHVEQGHKSGSASVMMWIIGETKSGRILKSKP